ncbi:16S rRNA (guanine(527)-N(7))-methyltransferase RsmG [uncultured Sulfitobacter sp.]|uniref:16S rRNA (guanine(527)-N(7))-methyltransferase RsmG n=1 Tax=uncultured Sulfitobacter sp. TaxID=191468 RepID=UPI00261FF1CE|nr:16S rRNA (guanine(527)-N(7))-methyltransferase RsmG [uncultured Sulfitobacter sp.]
MKDHRSLTDVSRETIERLREFEKLVLKWTKKINLVSSGDASQIWDRHIIDSVQIYDLAPEEGTWLDIGSGGGFPGIVAAIMAKEKMSDRSFILVDSDQRKCAFLRTVNRELGLNIKVLAERVEKMQPLGAEVMSARALDDLNGLFTHAERHLSTTGVALFPKGTQWEREHENAKKLWSYDIEVVKSETNPEATILKIKELTRV